MIKALFKKQWLQFLYALTRNRGRRKKNLAVDAGKNIGYLLIMLMAFVSLGFMFFMVGDALAGPLLAAGLPWLYYAITGMIALALGTLGSVFSTYSSLYLAKDNDLLLSMPIPPGKILMVRMVSVYLIGLLYEAIVMIPVFIAAWTYEAPTALTVVLQILLMLLLACVILALTCLLGWVVALISVRLKNKSYVTVALSLLFLGGYYYIYFKANELLQSLLMRIDRIEASLKRSMPPVYHFGQAATGNLASFFIFLAISLSVAVLTWYILRQSFLKLATTHYGAKQKDFKISQFRDSTKRSSLQGTLVKKEWKRFTASPTYMLNCAMGTILMPAAGVFLLIKGKSVGSLFASVGIPQGMLLIGAAAMIGMVICMNDLTAPSVSLEGHNYWILRSLPVPSRQILNAKQLLHLMLTLPPVLFLTAAMIVVLKPGVPGAVLLIVFEVAYTLLASAVGLILNLKKPNLDWTNETVPVKQSTAVMLLIFGSWGLMVGFGVLFYVLRDRISGLLYLGLWDVLLIGLVAWCNVWLSSKGAARFEELE